MKRLIYIILFVLLGQLSFGQQPPLYSQYLYNKFLINPAHAGSDGYTSFNLSVREQWVGYKGSPRSCSFSYQTRILKRGYILKQNSSNQAVYRPKTEGRVGLGCSVFSDSHGLISKTGIQTTYSFHFWIGNHTQLSMGLALTGSQFIINANENHFEDPTEPWLNNNLRRGLFVPDADCGIYIMHPCFEVGLSSHQLFGSVGRIGKTAYNSLKLDRHYYLFGSYSFKTTAKVEIRPSLLLNMSGQIKPQAGLGFDLIHNQSIWTGVSYRTGGSLITNVGFKHTLSRINMTAIYFGYSYDFTLAEIQRVTLGSHELLIAFKTGESAKRFRWSDRY